MQIQNKSSRPVPSPFGGGLGWGSGLQTLPGQINILSSDFVRLKRRMGDRKIDLVLQREGGGMLPIYELASQQGGRL